MTALRSQEEIRNTVVSLGLPEHPYFMRRTARAMDIVVRNKVHFLGENVYRVDSQFDDKYYHVELNHGNVGCNCEDYKKNGAGAGAFCKHIGAATIYKKQAITIVKTTDGEDGDYWKHCWLIVQGNRRTLVYEEPDGRLFCNCQAHYNDCRHKQLVIKTVTNELKSIAKEKRIVSDCGTEEAKAIQDKLNAQIDSQGNNGNGAKASSHIQLDLSNPFQEAESYDIDQIEGRTNGDLAWKLKSGKVVISYKGIMKLAESYDITFETAIHDDTHTVIAKGRCGTSERVSGKLINANANTAIALTQRNCARQLLPYAELKAVEHKAKLEDEFSWEVGYNKCAQLAGGEPQVDITIHELVKTNRLPQKSPSEYTRTEYLIIYNAIKNESSESTDDNNDGGEISPSSNDDEVNRYKVLAESPVNPNFQQRYDECKALVGMSETDLIIRQQLNFRYSYYKNKITDEQWDVVQKECKYRWNARQAKAEFASAQQAYKFKHIRDISGYDVKSKQFVGRPPLNSKEFLSICKQAIDEVREEKKSVEANELPLESGVTDGRRCLQMDRKLRTWLIEADGTKKKISCREICETFENKQNPSIVTQLRAGIDDGADISVVELD